MRRALGLIVAGYGVYLLHAYAAGALYFYINPIYIVPTAVTGAMLLTLGMIVGVAPRGVHQPSRVALGLLAVPLLLGFVLPARPLGVSTAAQRGVETTTPGRVDEVPEFRVDTRPETYNIKDWLTAMRADPDPASVAGKPVRVSGFVYRDRRLPEGWFLVARFVVQCCAVDATPIGLPVRLVHGVVPSDGTWILIEGVWEVEDVSGTQRAVVTPGSVTSIARPSQPYLY
jgi:uncharacterized repeat protein (TIGR03943 family)